ncbi:MAG: hypothetical protein JSW54_02960 [Fidelibacterota bacterium]|nr:MAG: hypothetical protein JSW54_02960 [Candidatus Neomarinimicrobiota bacterium]
MRNFTYDFVRAFYAPQRLYQDIHDGRPSPSWLCVLFYSLVYVVGCFWLYFTGHEPFARSWIILDPQNYYLVEAFFCLPLVFLLWIQAAGTLHVLSRLLGGHSHFDTVLRMTGYSIWAPWWILIPFDIFPTPAWLYNMVLVVCIVLMLAGTSAAVKAEAGTGWVAAIANTMVALTAMGVIMFTFIR